MLNKSYLKFLIILLTVLSTASLIGQVRGKLTGKVTDKDTNEPLVGVNVVIEGTSLGAATDINGNYFIIGIAPGEYDVKASFIGYYTITTKDVLIRPELSSKVNIQLPATSIEAPTVEVKAQRTLVQKDITSTRRTVTRETIKDVPGLETTADVFKLQGGTVLGQIPQTLTLANGQQLQVRDESVKDVHVRGGRGGEILFMVDGVPVNHPIYGGREVLDMNVVAVEQIELLTGAFSAEYGQAQSGVVNITTRSGGDKFKGGLEYKTDELKIFGTNYNTQYGTVYLSGPEPFTQLLLPQLGLNIPGKLHFFISANANLTNTPYNNHRTRGDIKIFGLKVKERQDNASNMNAKLSYDVTRDFRMAFSFNGSWKDWSNFEWDWKNYPDHITYNTRDNVNTNVLINHILSPKSYYTMNFGYLGVKYRNSLNGKSPDQFWIKTPDSIYTTAKPALADPLTYFYDSTGYSTIWRDDDTKTFTFKGDFTSQIHAEHLIKAGLEVQYNDISYVDIQDGGLKLSNYGEYVYNNRPYSPPPPGPYKEFGQYRWVFKVFPLIGGAYIQEKFEKEFLILNLGLRADWFLLGNTVNQQDWKKQWKDATGFEPDWKKYKIKFSPRFGISFPILEQTVIFFSYGHFFQLPELQYFYRDPYSGGITGNPKLDYEQTILYEFGFTHQLFEDWAIDIKSYAKDISNQVGSTALKAYKGVPVSLFDNVGFARARGLEFEITKGFSYFTAGKLTYTVQWADGYSSSAFDDYIRSLNDFPSPIRERRLGWDVRHQIILQASLSSPENQPINIFGFQLPDDWNITILASFSSGQPYTPGTNDPVEAQKKENTSTGPVTATTDIKFNKGFNIFGTKLSLVMDIFNVFDQNNTVVGRGFNTWSGTPYKYGDTDSPTSQYFDWYKMVYLRDPMQFTTGIYVKLGFRWDF
ncbi:MAG: TonB-dependent receptor [Ignavibacteriales bacterium]|nr:TonB-dependent receptor [Ignavibacteriales bacterium]